MRPLSLGLNNQLLSGALLNYLVAVGTALASRPPHRSGREMLPHPAPTLGSDAETPIRRGASRTCLRPLDRYPLSLSTEPVDLNQIPLGQGPSLHHLRRSVAQIPSGLKDLCSMASQVLLTCPTARQHSCWDYGLRPSPARLANFLPATAELSRLPHMERTHMPQVSDSGELDRHSRYRIPPQAGLPSPAPY